MIAVLGPGGVGGFIAAALTRAGGDVVVVARESTVEAIARDGINVQSVRLGEFVARPRACGLLREPAEALFVATKALELPGALERIAAVPAVVVPLLNGLDHVAHLRERFGQERVVAGTIRIEADRPAPGRVVHTSPMLRVDLAADDTTLAARLPAIAQALERAGIPTQIGPSEKQVLWSKLVRLNALASTTSASDLLLGAIRSDPEWREALIGAVEEGAAVATADGASVAATAALAELDGAHATLGSSMQRDLAAGRTPELDAIQGSVLRAGARLGVPCPTIARLSAVIAARAGIPAPS